MREVGLVFECLHCETYFVNTVKLIDLSENRGKKRDLLTDTYISLQKHYEDFRNRYQLCVCPTCNELIYQSKYQDLDQNCILSLCRVFKFLKEDDLQELSSNSSANNTNGGIGGSDNNVGSSASHASSSTDETNTTNNESSFMDLFEISNKDILKGYEMEKSNGKKQHGKKSKEEKKGEEHDPDIHVPLYMDVGTNAGESQKKQKWELVFGVGPARLELDSSRSGRIYKPSLRSLNLPHISTSLYKLPENVITSDIQSQCEKIVELVQGLDEQALTDLILNVLVKKIPLYEHFDEISELITEQLSSIRHIREIEKQEEMELARHYKGKTLTDILSKKSKQ
ncbi:predicted protein [Naegleria gruberi]|uniref:Predicted protein n=1 Tax=Naegleria gruberi TaxID=5762 RepID=D2VVL4_NAEGR|nr:uncharacterized protein NAEGRDRAFT_73060 [Naegleria gruberi]EFC39058.1 predicted protein [Naegleria gruberi]|eukprot:XP_002671802.1 predicted protein [Naegleria gruberi strain NEG-M]